ncbi:MAG: TerC family protein [Cytophagales bacterium]|nr:TerC family protein [Armatimonadota bacterium]
MPEIHVPDLLVVATLVVLEGLLSADNALVLALLVRHLPEDQQKKALLYGLFGAFTLRGIGIFLAKFIMNLWPICAIGSVYLLGLAIRHFTQRHETPEEEAASAGKKRAGFWHTVFLVEVTDIVFAVDSILVAVALVNNPNKLWIVYTGGFLGIVLLRLAASFFIALIKKYPTLDHMAYGLVGWAGVKLASTTVDIFYRSRGVAEENLPHLLKAPIFWTVFVLIVAGGAFYAVRHKRTKEDEEDSARNDEALECLEDGGFVIDRAPPPGPESVSFVKRVRYHEAKPSEDETKTPR